MGALPFNAPSDTTAKANALESFPRRRVRTFFLEKKLCCLVNLVV